jgi:hypothetical protein
MRDQLTGSGIPPALVREIALWRAANGTNPQDPRPTGGGGELDAAAALWKQRLDWHIAPSTGSSGNDRFIEGLVRPFGVVVSDPPIDRCLGRG